MHNNVTLGKTNHTKLPHKKVRKPFINKQNKNNNNRKKRILYKKKGRLVHSVKSILYAISIGFILFGLLSKKLINLVVDKNNLPTFISALSELSILSLFPNEDDATNADTNDLSIEGKLTKLINDKVKNLITPLIDEFDFSGNLIGLEDSQINMVNISKL